MGNTLSKNTGLAILNRTRFKITCGCSMVGTQRYENDIEPGQIFYRWPGAVWMTLFAIPSTSKTRYSDMKCAGEIATIAGSVLVLAALGPAAIGASPVVGGAAVVVAGVGLAGIGDVFDGLSLADITHFRERIGLYLPEEEQFNTREKIDSFQKAMEDSKLYAARRGCYAGGNGTWLILEGGPIYENERWTASDFRFVTSTRDELREHGTFTAESEACYFRGDDGYLATVVGLPTNKND